MIGGSQTTPSSSASKMGSNKKSGRKDLSGMKQTSLLSFFSPKNTNLKSDSKPKINQSDKKNEAQSSFFTKKMSSEISKKKIEEILASTSDEITFNTSQGSPILTKGNGVSPMDIEEEFDFSQSSQPIKPKNLENKFKSVAITPSSDDCELSSANLSSKSTVQAEKKSKKSNDSDAFDSTGKRLRRGSHKVNYASFDADSESDDSIADASMKINKKKKRYIESDDESDAFMPENNESSSSESEAEVDEKNESEESCVESEGSEEEYGSSKNPKQRKAAKIPIRKQLESKEDGSNSPIPRTPRALKLSQFSLKSPAINSPISNGFNSPLNRVSSATKPKPGNGKESNEERYSWLLDIKDAEKRLPTDPDYDPRTLFVPQSAWKKFTAFEKQYWEIKCKLWDTVVFFKKGKFYELYENDADIGHQKFDLKMVDRVNMRMVGVPEKSFDNWCAQFVAHGFKVAKVDQTENTISKGMRSKNEVKSNEPKIIKRELACILTSGTLVDTGLLTNDMSTYCISIHETISGDIPTFGIVLLDAASAEFLLSSFEDDKHRTKFETLIAQTKPKEIIVAKNGISSSTSLILKNNCPDSSWNNLIPDTEFMDFNTAKYELKNSGYFKSNEDGSIILPEALEKCDASAQNAFGGMLFYLKYLKLDKELLTAQNFELYDPIKESGTLILDGQTLTNLEVFSNNTDGTSKGSIFKLINHCVTPFGQRLLKKWLCHPLRSVEDIKDRQIACEELNDIYEDIGHLIQRLSGLPDIERLITRIHAGSCKVKDFIDILNAFESLISFFAEFESILDSNNNELGHSVFLRKLLVGLPQHCMERLQYFSDAFNKNECLSADDNTIKVHKGYDNVVDEATAAEDAILEQIEEERKRCEKEIRCKIQMKHQGKELFQMEVQKSAKVPSDWHVKSQTNSVSRYWNRRIEKLVLEYQEASEIKTEALKNAKSRLCEKFDEYYKDWLAASRRLASIDCLLSIAKFNQTLSMPKCRPELLSNNVSRKFDAVDLRYPTGDPNYEYCPNSIQLGKNQDKDQSIILLTGPNMGGKSTLLRQTCIAVILAQLGCYLPATSCEMSVIDRIFTRLGASDNILGGESTFMVELAETSKIIREATPQSLVILDELGRGTSTFDGYSIAFAVLHQLVQHTKCLGLFSTHYQALTEEFSLCSKVRNMHMGFMIDENDSRSVIFLYKLTNGACPKSYGMNVAQLAGVPSSVVDVAEKIATEFEKVKALDIKKINSMTNLLSLANFVDIYRDEKF